MIDNKGLTDEQIQKLIDYKIECIKFEEKMWKLYATQMISDIIFKTLIEAKKDEPH
jgi:hypothetical protein